MQMRCSRLSARIHQLTAVPSAYTNQSFTDGGIICVTYMIRDAGEIPAHAVANSVASGLSDLEVGAPHL